MIKNIKNYVIPKPWGNEYLFFENKDIGIWLLNINYNQRTSLHCHPKKKTGLIVLDGEIDFSFLNNVLNLKESKKIMIWPGVFHSSKSNSENGSVVIEVESPKNKYDLVRIEDEYNRQHKGYEKSNTWIKRNSSHHWLNNKIGDTLNYKNFNFSIEFVSKKNINEIENKKIFIILSQICIQTKEKIPVCKVGDILTGETLKYLSNKFNLLKTKVIAINYESK
jgi:mannose-6-phosphate isomerase-like protein (cupin superfamily)